MNRPEALIRLLPPCLHWHPDGAIRLVGHRIGLYDVVYYYNQGYTAEMLRDQFPTLDLDLILFGSTILQEPELTIPHPRFRERRFVLEPLAAIAPDLRDPVTSLTVAQLLARLPPAR